MAYPAWMYQDPCRVAMSREAQRNKPTKQQRARQGLEALFNGGHMGVEMKKISKEHLRTMFQWGDWAKRPQFWTDLRITPFCRLVGIMPSTGSSREVRLDPQSLAIHKAVMRREPKTQAVLYTYYVTNQTYDQAERAFREAGIGRGTFYRLLEEGTRIVCNGAKLDQIQHDVALKKSGTKSAVLGYDSAMV